MVPAVMRSMKAIVSQDFRKVAIGVFHGRRFSTSPLPFNEIGFNKLFERVLRLEEEKADEKTTNKERISHLEGGRKNDFFRFGFGSAGFVGGIYYLHRRIDDTNKRIEDTNKRIDDTKSELKGKIDDTNKRIDDTNARIGDLSSRVETLQQSVNSTNIMLGRIAEKLQVSS